MPTCDPYTDPAATPTVIVRSPHQRLVCFLETQESSCSVKPSSASKSGISGLPKEILEHVFPYITSKHDLAQLCKVDHHFFSTALPLLYRTLNITITNVLDPHQVQMFTRENAGLRYVKEVTAFPGKTRDRHHKAAHQWLDVVINQIAKDTLIKFRWEMPHPLPSRLLRLLWQRQQKLQCLEIFAPFVTRNRAEELTEIDLLAELNHIDFPDLTGVRAVPDSPETALLACAAIKREKVTHLEVDGRLWHGGDARVVEDDAGADDSTPKVEDRLTECLFSHVKPVAAGRIPNCGVLTSLTLKDINLTLCKHTWYTYLELSQLKHLRLEHCNGADIFLMKLAAGAATPGLHSFILVHDLGRRPDRTIHAIEDLLTAPRNKLQQLELALRNAPQLPSPTCIRAHGKSLRSLLLDVETRIETNDRDPNDWDDHPDNPDAERVLAYIPADLRSIVQSCSSLLELGIALPDVGLEYKELSSEFSEFKGCIDVIASNLKLTTLNILNRPEGYNCHQSTGYYIAKNLQLARLAKDIFARHRHFDWTSRQFVKADRHPTLEIVAFGIREKQMGLPPPVYFVQSEVNVLGKETNFDAYGVDLKYLQEQNFDLRVLNYEERDFDEPSRKSFGASRGWDRASDDGNDFNGGWA